MTPRAITIIIASLLLLVAPIGAVEQVLEGRVLTQGRQQITIGATGLPEQVIIAPAPAELPLAVRAVGEVDPTILSEIGRGPQLRGPIRLEVTVGGEVTVAEVEAVAAPSAVGGAVRVESTLVAGAVRIKLMAAYRPDGRIELMLTPAAPVAVEAVELVVETVGRIDTVVDAGAFAQLPVDPVRTALGGDPGVAWSTAERGIAGIPTHIFVGDGDRGFGLSTDGANWVTGGVAPVHAVVRGEDGSTTWRIAVVGAAGALPTAPLSATLTAYPTALRPADHRSRAWLAWDAADAPNALAAWTAQGATARVLSGSAGGVGADAASPIATSYPLAAYRYLAGTATGQVARIVPATADHGGAGSGIGLDRSVIGRALLHDVGVDASGLAHLAEARAVVEALHRFGAFAGDAATEFIPYWRSQRYLRYGQVFETGGGFEITESDPNAGVSVSIYRRPVPETLAKGKGGMQAIIAIVNEGDHDVEDLLYINNPKDLFGGGNTASISTAMKAMLYDQLPPNADWELSGTKGPRGKNSALIDLIDGGLVQSEPEKGTGREVYGAIHVPAHGYRLLWAYSGK